MRRWTENNSLKLAAGITLLLLGPILASSQQIPQFTHYMFNSYLYNPGVAGTNNFYQIRATNRMQWVGMNDAPTSFNMSVYGPHTNKDMGFGAYIFTDLTGPTSRTGFLGSYAYNIQLSNSDMRLSGGLSFGLMQYKVDGSKLTLGENGDITTDQEIINSLHPVFTPDASIGFYLYSSHYFFGISAHQLLGQKLKLYPNDISANMGINRLKQHLLLSGSYWISLNRDLELDPTLLIKYMFNSPLQFELSLRATYKSQFWGGVSYRYKDAISFLMGYNYKNRYMFGLSFDYSLFGIRKYNAGTYEIMVGYMFDKIK